MKEYKEEKINTILSNLELDMKHDDEYSYRDIDSELKEVYENIDKIVDYVDNGFNGKLYLNSNIWLPCYEALTDILNIYNLKFIGSDKVTEQEEVISITEYINNRFKELNLTTDTPDDIIQGFYISSYGLSVDVIMTPIEEKRKTLYTNILNELEKNKEITHEQRCNYAREYLKIEEPQIDFNNSNDNPDIEMGTIFRFGKYVCEVDDYNQENPNESIVFIYKSQADLDNGEYLEQVSLLNKNIKDNIEEYMEKNYYIKPITRLSILQELQDQVSNDLLSYSKTFLMNTPKNGYEQEWKLNKEKYDLIQQMVKEEKNRTNQKQRENDERGR